MPQKYVKKPNTSQDVLSFKDTFDLVSAIQIDAMNTPSRPDRTGKHAKQQVQKVRVKERRRKKK